MSFPEADSFPAQQIAPRRGMPVWVWVVLLVVFGTVVLPFVALVAWVGYVGVYGPDTSVYTGNRVPSRFIETMRDVKALDEGEELVYFYSDAMTDITDGFYFVSDKKVVIYTTLYGDEPLTVIPFDQIRDASLDRDESFLLDSEITIETVDDDVISFPVSSEYDRDEAFYNEIRERSPNITTE